MPTIIKKGTNNSAFRLKNGRTIVIRTGFGGGDDLNILTERDFDDLMAEYGAFIKPRVLSDSNPNGCLSYMTGASMRRICRVKLAMKSKIIRHRLI